MQSVIRRHDIFSKALEYALAITNIVREAIHIRDARWSARQGPFLEIPSFLVFMTMERRNKLCIRRDI